METATFAGGCFWCTEAIFQMIRGVTKVVSGYAGGVTDSPSYKDVSTGKTGYAEAIQITFDPKLISYKDLLYIFFKTHDPTTPNRQRADFGTQYRSMIFYHSKAQKKMTEIALTEVRKDYSSPIVTQIVQFKNFYEAENYHQSFYNKNPNAVYCQLVIDSKIEKLKKDFKDYLKL